MSIRRYKSLIDPYVSFPCDKRMMPLLQLHLQDSIKFPQSKVMKILQGTGLKYL